MLVQFVRLAWEFMVSMNVWGSKNLKSFQPPFLSLISKLLLKNGEFLFLFYHSFQKFNLQSNTWNSFQMNFWRFFVDKMDKKNNNTNHGTFDLKIYGFHEYLGVEKLEKLSAPFFNTHYKTSIEKWRVCGPFYQQF